MSSKYLYSRYIRIWHWVQASAIVLLLLTGFLLHSPLQNVDFAALVNAHNVLAVILLANALLGFFYYLTTGEIGQYNIFERGFFQEIIAQLRYYGYGIFHGDKHPSSKSPMKRMNMLQRTTYIAVLGILLPVQAISGVLLWNSQHWTHAVASLGGAHVVSAVHSTTAWLFAAFIIMHIYMATTGHTWYSNFVAMVTGWELVDDEPTSTNGGNNEK